MLKINIDLIRLSEELAKEQGATASNFRDFGETTESENLARDILAPLAVDALFSTEGDYHQASAASFGKLGAKWWNACAVCGSALWWCGDSEEAKSLTLADGFRPRAFGLVKGGACFVLILESTTGEEEKERAYLVRYDY